MTSYCLAENTCAAHNGGWGAELHREIVACRACVRAGCMSSESDAKKLKAFLLFAFSGVTFSPYRNRERDRKTRRDREREKERKKESLQPDLQLQLALWSAIQAAPPRDDKLELLPK